MDAQYEIHFVASLAPVHHLETFSITLAQEIGTDGGLNASAPKYRIASRFIEGFSAESSKKCIVVDLQFRNACALTSTVIGIFGQRSEQSALI